MVEEFKESKTKTGEDIIRIRASIFVMRETQKAIILGKGGSAIKNWDPWPARIWKVFSTTKYFWN